MIPKDSDAASATSAQSASPRILDSRELFAGFKEILIAHDGGLYRLKITRQGKLILNK